MWANNNLKVQLLYLQITVLAEVHSSQDHKLKRPLTKFNISSME